MRDFEAIRSKLRTLKPLMEQQYAVRRIGIFGSVARGDQRMDSDIDLMVEFARPVGIAFIDLADMLESELGVKVDLVSRNGVKPAYLKHIEKDIRYV